MQSAHWLEPICCSPCRGWLRLAAPALPRHGELASVLYLCDVRCARFSDQIGIICDCIILCLAEELQTRPVLRVVTARCAAPCSFNTACSAACCSSAVPHSGFSFPGRQPVHSFNQPNRQPTITSPNRTVAPDAFSIFRCVWRKAVKTV